LRENYSRIIVIVDENTEVHCLPLVEPYLGNDYHVIVIPAGENYKNLNTASFIWQEMAQVGADRHSLCINLGGGVIGDMGGWTAASYMRGMDFIQIPTTLLSMVDASVGGKLAIDFRGFKNMVGLIKDPLAVIIHSDFLNTLPERLIKSGMAEVLKHGLIADQYYWDHVKEYGNKTSIPWDQWIYESVLIKKKVTEVDPMERGLRKILNFGHTIGHAIESYSLDHDVDPLTHGEAIAIGMICESYLSMKASMISGQDLSEITQGILSTFGKEKRSLPQMDDIKIMLSRDKKNKGGSVMYSLLEKIGKATYNQQVPEEDVIASLQYYNSL
jgi:3-dehydroquinate synthase